MKDHQNEPVRLVSHVAGKSRVAQERDRVARTASDWVNSACMQALEVERKALATLRR